MSQTSRESRIAYILCNFDFSLSSFSSVLYLVSVTFCLNQVVASSSGRDMRLARRFCSRDSERDRRVACRPAEAGFVNPPTPPSLWSRRVDSTSSDVIEDVVLTCLRVFGIRMEHKRSDDRASHTNVSLLAAVDKSPVMEPKRSDDLPVSLAERTARRIRVPTVALSVSSSDFSPPTIH